MTWALSEKMQQYDERNNTSKINSHKLGKRSTPCTADFFCYALSWQESDLTKNWLLLLYIWAGSPDSSVSSSK